MSGGIYEDVIRTESEGMNRERVEMAVVIYESAGCVSDQDFRTESNTHQPLQHTGSDCVKIRSSRAAPVCLLLLCFLLLTAVVVLSVHIYMNYTEETHQLLTNRSEERNQPLSLITNLTEERDQLLSMITNLTEERDGLKLKNKYLTDERDRVLNKDKNNDQNKERDQFNQERNELWKMLTELDGRIYQSSFYYMSSEEKSWTESSRYCRERGADLFIINSKEEQEFVKTMSGGAGVWIGLTDSDEEDTWKWVDGRTLTSGFWVFSEPNGKQTENCAALYPSGWYDYPCDDAFKSICEKNIKNSN